MVCLLVRYAHLYFEDLPRVFDRDLGVSAYRVLGLEKVVVCRLFGAERSYMLLHVEDVGCIGELHTESWYLASISCSLCGTEIMKLCCALLCSIFMYADKRSRTFSVQFNDEVDADTWSPIMVENLVEEIGWEMAGRLKVYYCIPILSINRNGLREIRGDSDTDQMLTFVSIGHYSFSLYLDHEDSLNANLREDDVVNFPIR